MTPPYTPDGIELWRELRVAFDSTTDDYKAFCHLSRSFELAYGHLYREEIKNLARDFLDSHPDIQCRIGKVYLFRDYGTPSNHARSRFIDWNIERLSVKVETRPDNEETRAEDAEVEQQHAEEVAED